MNTPAQRALVSVTGPDHLGITAALTEVIAAHRAELLDIEQVVVQRQLTLCVLVSLPSGALEGDPLIGALRAVTAEMGLDLQVRALGAPETEEARAPRYAVTAIGDGLGASGVNALSTALASHGANIEWIRRLSTHGLTSLEIICALPGREHAVALRRSLIEAVEGRDIDVAVQRETLTRRSKRLVVMDMDSTLIQVEVVDELARLHGVADAVADITRRAMEGELDYEASLRERVRMLAGLRFADVRELARNLPLQTGARDLVRVLHTLGFRTAVISGGFEVAAQAVKDELGLHYAYANRLEVKDGVLTGEVLDPVVTPSRKADLLDAIAQQESIALEQTIAIGDGANDLLMLERAGLGIAFHAKPALKQAADTSLSAGGLDRVLYLLGLHARDVNELLNG
ncbi:MAG: phosphoserine phosphatase SerB [Sandaracinaceae bacterium]|nr:phosphoserine phosphatase SerB [Myxococcales bacterium]